MARAPEWRPLRTEDGSWTLVQSDLGQACHSASGAWREARERYGAATRLRARARGRGAVALLDVGTGVGWNLAAALAALEGTGARLVAVTFEHDAGVLEAAARLPVAAGPGLRWLGAVHRALEHCLRGDGPARLEVDGEERGDLRLELGDARERILHVPPSPTWDAVFLDAFSPAVDPPLWEPGFLTELARRMAPGSWLSTYTASLTVRERLARAGLRVGSGPRVGTKAQGTLASPDREPPPLDPRAARKLARRLLRPHPKNGPDALSRPPG